MSDLNVVGLRFEVDIGDGKTKIIQMRRALSDTTATVKTLNDELGDNVRVTEEKVQTDKEVAAQARLIVNHQERQRKKTAEVVRQYTTLNNTIRQYGNDAETVNAITRLGSTATDAQKQKVAELVAEYQRLRNAGDAGTESMRNMRGIAQNLGWQLQDVVVQAQMGTDAFIILSQQGSQFAAAFGHIGALIGAGIAIAGAAMPALIEHFKDTNDETSKLNDIQKSLNATFEQSSITANGLSSEMRELYKANKNLAELKMVVAFNEAESAMFSLRTEVDKTLGETLTKFTQMQNVLNSGVDIQNSLMPQNQAAFKTYLDNISASLQNNINELGLTTEQVGNLNEAYTEFTSTGNTSDLVTVFNDISKAAKNKLTPDLREMISAFVNNAEAIELNRSQLERLRSILSGSATPTVAASKITETLEQRYRRLRAQLTMTDRQVEIDNFLKLEAINLTGDQVQSTQRALIAYLDERDAIEARNDEIERAKALDDARIKQRSGLLDPIEQSLIVTSSNPVDAENERNKQTMDTLRAQLTQTKQYEYSERARINQLIEDEEQRHAEALFNAQLTLASNQVAVIGSTADFMANLTNELFDGGEKVREQMEEMSAAQKAMFFFQRSIAAAQAFINGQVLGMELAKQLGWAAPVGVTFGTSLGAASAGAIMGTTFAGAFDKGGFIPSGSTGIVSEYGDELVNGQLVRGPARVTSREDTAKMMNGGGMTVNLINNAPGVDHQVNRIDENTVEVIANKVFANNIDSGVASVLNKKGTKTDRAMRQNYQGGARKY